MLDRQARGLSPRTIKFQEDELGHLQEYLKGAGITEIQRLNAYHFRGSLLQLRRTHNPGGVHATYRAVRALLNWWDTSPAPNSIHALAPGSGTAQTPLPSPA